MSSSAAAASASSSSSPPAAATTNILACPSVEALKQAITTRLLRPRFAPKLNRMTLDRSVSMLPFTITFDRYSVVLDASMCYAHMRDTRSDEDLRIDTKMNAMMLTSILFYCMQDIGDTRLPMRTYYASDAVPNVYATQVTEETCKADSKWMKVVYDAEVAAEVAAAASMRD